MDEQAQKALSDYRMELAKNSIHASELLINGEEYRDALSRSYYAVFHCVRAVLALDGKDFSKHSAVASYFRHEYIKTGLLDPELSDILKEAFDVRSSSDYDDFYVVSKEKAKTQVDNAKHFFNAVEAYIKKRCA